jgi:hypothetical protein
LTIALALVGSAPVLGQNSAESRATLSGIRGVVVYVDTLSPALPQKGITRDVLKLKVERCLRDAGVPVLEAPLKERVAGDPVLMLGVATVFDDEGRRCACSLRLEFTQTVRLERNPGHVVFGMPTWSVGRVGLYTNRWREELIEDVYLLTDEFIDAYYRGNPVAGR